MGLVRVMKRALAVLAFVCITLKINLELRVLNEGRNVGYSPWWGNETLGHLRAFPKRATRPGEILNNALLPKLITSNNINNNKNNNYNTYNNIKNNNDNSINDNEKGLPTHVQLKNPQKKGSKYDSMDSTRRILSNAKNIANKNNQGWTEGSRAKEGKGTLEGEREGAGTVTMSSSNLNSYLIRKNFRGAKSKDNQRTLAGIFARLRIHDGERVFDTDDIYTSQKVAGVSVEVNTTADNTNAPKSYSEKNLNQQAGDKVVVPNEQIHHESNATKKNPRLSPVPIPMAWIRPPQPTPSKNKREKTQKLKGVSHAVDENEISLTKEEIANIKLELKYENERQKVYNEDRLGPIESNTTILLVQVHKRLENLRYLVASLQKVKGIEGALVIFSHDFWDRDINAFVREIKEFRVMQMFFPFSIQLYPHLFPGRDPMDCYWNNKTNGKDTNSTCLNAKWPDSYGHYREAAFTQIKHHWWWKINRVFEGLRVTSHNYSGHVIFLEEDHYASPDLLHVLSLLQRQRPALCPSCHVLALGNYNKMNPNVYKNSVEQGDWWVAKYNLGFAMDREAWQLISQCNSKFCAFDDYNWDWTLTNIAQTCHPNMRVSMLAVRLSRVLHVGSCGTHVRQKVCDVKGEVRAAVNRLSRAKQWLFPEKVKLQGARKNSGKPKKGNGGWGDLRDRELCLAIGNHTADEATLARLQSLTSL